jgi:hypothetical protein
MDLRKQNGNLLLPYSPNCLEYDFSAITAHDPA